MKNNEIHTTSSLRQERNTNNPRSFLQKRNGKGLGNWCILFMEALAQRGVRPGMIIRHSIFLRPFLEYLEEKHGITAVTSLERSHVEAYAAAVSNWYAVQERTLTATVHADDLLSVVKMFCQYLYTAGMVLEDYGL